ncbi:LysE family translocator [Yoonia maritima]|uniref:LysE family translocator n=1 Tax=Yoonia maritima TaxID=1435347 RepID=UPI003736DE52
MKWIGFAYLIYLTGMALFSSSGGMQVRVGEERNSRRALFTHGFIVEFANPKALLYFAAILPQFLDQS